jgi:type I restriction enzyme S subunit
MAPPMRKPAPSTELEAKPPFSPSIPPLDEQISLGEKMRALDEAIFSESEALGRLMHTKSALMSDLLTGRKRVPDAATLAAE